MAKYIVRKANLHAENQIHPDEPCFVIRATDQFATDMVRYYFDLVERNGASEEFCDDVEEHLDRIKAWQWLNKDKVKFPD